MGSLLLWRFHCQGGTENKTHTHKFSAVKKLNQSDMLTKGPLGWWMRKASVRSRHLRVRSQTCGVLEERTLQKERENSRHEGSAVGRHLACVRNSEEAGLTGAQ